MLFLLDRCLPRLQALLDKQKYNLTLQNFAAQFKFPNFEWLTYIAHRFVRNVTLTVYKIHLGNQQTMKYLTPRFHIETRLRMSAPDIAYVPNAFFEIFHTSLLLTFICYTLFLPLSPMNTLPNPMKLENGSQNKLIDSQNFNGVSFKMNITFLYFRGY